MLKNQAFMISPSLMCADLVDLKKDLYALENAGADMLHFDVMDGEFVPNYTLGTDFIKRVRKATRLPFDIHLMVQKPEIKLDYFEFAAGDYVSIHYEASANISRALQKIREKGSHPLIAINPGTPVHVLSSIIHEADGILIMSVNPGFAGQQLIGYTIEKITQSRMLLKEKKMEWKLIEVDGNVSYQNAVVMRKAGADIFVAGTSSVYDGNGIENGIHRLKQMIGNADCTACTSL